MKTKRNPVAKAIRRLRPKVIPAAKHKGPRRKAAIRRWLKLQREI